MHTSGTLAKQGFINGYKPNSVCGLKESENKEQSELDTLPRDSFSEALVCEAECSRRIKLKY